MVSLTIDGRNITVPAGTTILEAARELGITIPTLCWLEKVSPTGACRVCAVEVAGVDRTMTACNTPVKEGIQVTTQSERLTEIRRKVMELMLVNHPLDCPVCDAAGECDLQDSCYSLDVTKQEYSALLERRPIRYDWRLLESDPNRCILCEKCVKVDHEIVGCDAIRVVNRGEATIIDTADGKPLDCEFCGNCIAACPTGTLISKPFKFRGRPWSFAVTKSICAFCGCGCQIEYHAKDGRVERVTSDDATYNSGNLCINGRFGYSYLNSPDRLLFPLVRGAEGQVKSDWDTALAAAAEGLKGVIAAHGPDAVAGIGSPRLTNEESFLFQKLLRGGVGTNNIDSEARLGYARAREVLRRRGVAEGNTIDRIDAAKAVLVVGTDLNAEATGIGYRIIKAATKNDARLVLANMRDVKLKKFANCHLRYAPAGTLSLINGIAKAIVDQGLADGSAAAVSGYDAYLQGLAGLDLTDLAATAGVTVEDLREAASLVSGKESVALVFGSDLIRGPQADEAVDAVVNLALLTGAIGKEEGGLFAVDEKNNTRGLLDAGVAPDLLPGGLGYDQTTRFSAAWGRPVPGTPGKDLGAIISGIEAGTIRALCVAGCDLTTLPDNARIREALAKLDLLVVQDIFPNGTTHLAHVVLPAAAAAEKRGTFTSLDGRVQGLAPAVLPPGEAREDGEILVGLYNRLVSAAGTFSPEGTLAEYRALAGTSGAPVAAPAFAPVASAAAATSEMTLLTGPILFHSGTTTFRSENNLTVAPAGYVEISSEDAYRLGIADGAAVKLTSAAGSVVGPAKVTERLQTGLLFAPHHFPTLNVTSLLSGNANRVAVKAEKG